MCSRLGGTVICNPVLCNPCPNSHLSTKCTFLIYSILGSSCPKKHFGANQLQGAVVYCVYLKARGFHIIACQCARAQFGCTVEDDGGGREGRRGKV